RTSVGDGAEVLARSEMCSDYLAWPGLPPPEKAVAIDPHQGHRKDRAHARPHRLSGVGITRGADQHDAGSTDGIGCADDGAEIAGIADLLERDPHGIRCNLARGG